MRSHTETNFHWVLYQFYQYLFRSHCRQCNDPQEQMAFSPAFFNVRGADMKSITFLLFGSCFLFRLLCFFLDFYFCLLLFRLFILPRIICKNVNPVPFEICNIYCYRPPKKLREGNVLHLFVCWGYEVTSCLVP